MSRSAYVTSLFGLALTTFLLALARDSTAGPSGERVFNAEKVRDVREIILKNYVDPPEEFDKKLYFGALRGMTDALDPYTQFLPPKGREELNIETRGKFGGLGIEIRKPMGRMGPIVIIRPFLGTPASKAGLLAGDRIVEIEGESTIGMDLDKAVHMLRGDPGTPVKIKVRAGPSGSSGAIDAGRVLQGCRLVVVDGESVAGRKVTDILDIIRKKSGKKVHVTVVPEQLGEARDVEIVRAVIRVPVVEFAHMVDDEAGIGYVRLARFQEDSARKLRDQIEGLRDKGMRAFVFDLRGNPGGLLWTAIEVSELFLEKGKVVVSTQARERRGRAPRFDFKARRDGPYKGSDMPVAILVDQYTASAAEIVAAAVHDHHRGIVVGARTFGKGSVQKPFDVDLGADPKTGERMMGYLKLTIEKYYTPSGTSLQRERDSDTWGVEPDIKVEMTRAERVELSQQWEKDKIAEHKAREGEADVAPPRGGEGDGTGDPPQGGEGKGEKGEGEEDKKETRAADRPLEEAVKHLRTVLFFAKRDETGLAAD